MIKPTRTRSISAGLAALACFLLFAGCRPANQVNRTRSASMPQRIIWAWERAENLRFLDPTRFGVAFLAQTIYLEKDAVSPRARRQPLDIAQGTYLIAVTRIETNKDGAKRPDLSSDMVDRVTHLIRSTLELPDVKAIQIDFDAVVSERAFYRSLMIELRKQLPPDTPLTMTALASWCTGDAWFNDFPVDEAVPMVFRMGADEENIKTYLRNGNDWREPLCRGSYGISVEDQLRFDVKPDRRIYYFKNSSWRADDLRLLK